MKRSLWFTTLLMTAASLLLTVVTSCKNEAYDTGDASLSYLRADFVEAYTGSDGKIATARTDDGDSLLLSSATAASWSSTPDTLLRALLYYKLQPQDAADGTSNTPRTKIVQPVRAYQVYVLRPSATAETMTDRDPVVLQSAWMIRSLKYVNLSVALRTGTDDGSDSKQRIGVKADTLRHEATGSRTFVYHFLHAQNGVPKYYKQTVYASIPLPAGLNHGDTIRVTVPDESGTVTRDFPL